MKFVKKTDGFTLVELIVVIAILAILAAIAVPAYSGYIQKANEAGDQQLLAAVNTAFGAACLENNTDMLNLNKATIGLNGDGSVGNIKEVAAKTGTAPNLEALNEAFDTYFAGNQATVFKTFRGHLVLDPTKGVFVDATAGGYRVGVSGSYNILVSDTDADTYASSQWNLNDDLGTEELLIRVDDLTKLGDSLTGVFADAAFQQLAADSLGVGVDKLSDKLDELSGNDPAKKNEMMGNAAVLFAANQISGMKQETIDALFSSENPYEYITTNANGGEAFSQASLMYGMYTVYAAQNGITVTTDPFAELTNMSADPNFKAYLQGNTAYGDMSADLAAFQAAMKMVDESKDDPAALNSVLNNGFTDSDLQAAINQILGN